MPDGVTPAFRRVAQVNELPEKRELQTEPNTLAAGDSGTSVAVGDGLPAAQPAPNESLARLPVPEALLVTGELEIIPLWLLDDSPTQPREHEDQVKHEQLCDSMREHGFLHAQAIMARPSTSPAFTILPINPDHPEGDCELRHPVTGASLHAPQMKRDTAEMVLHRWQSRFEKVFGHRRARAAASVGMTAVPVQVRELTNSQVLELQWIENGHREDLNPIEEARHLERMLALKGDDGKPVYTLESLAKRLGYRDKVVIGEKLPLNNLAGEMQEAIAKGVIAEKIGTIVGRIPTEQAREIAAKEILHPEVGDGPLNVAAATELVRKRCTRNLSGVIFEREDETLVTGRPSCLACPHNSASQKEAGRGRSKFGICDNIECFAAKEAADWERWTAQHHKPDQGFYALSRERCAEIFDDEGALDWKSGLVDLLELPQAGLLAEDAELVADQMWRKLTDGRLREVFIARDHKGKRRELADVDVAKEAAELNGHRIFKTSKAAIDEARESGTDAEHASATLDEKKRKDDSQEYAGRCEDRILSAIAGKVTARGYLAPQGWLLLLRYLMGVVPKAAARVEARRSCAAGALLDVHGDGEENQLMALAVELVVADLYAEGYDEFAGEWVSFFGVSLNEAAKAVRAEMDAETAPQATAAAVSKKRKKKDEPAAVPPAPEPVVSDPAPAPQAEEATSQQVTADEEKRAALPPLPDPPDGWEWDDSPNGMQYEWNESGVCTNPDRIIAHLAKKLKMSMSVEVAFCSERNKWFYGWQYSATDGGGAPVSKVHESGFLTASAALRWGLGEMRERGFNTWQKKGLFPVFSAAILHFEMIDGVDPKYSKADVAEEVAA